MSIRRRLSATVALAVLLSAPAAFAQQMKMPRVDLDYDEEIDFSALKTYSWKDPAAAAKDPQMHTRIIWYVERELEKKGLTKKPEGDVLVRYYTKGHEGLKGTPTQSQSHLPGGTGSLTTGVDFQKVLEGTLILELQRASDQKPVWCAGTQYRSIDKKRIDAETASAVRLLMSKYPPPKP